MESAPQRVWRLRKFGHAVDAELQRMPLGGWTIHFLYDGVPTYQRTWPEREQALGEAAVKRAELERSGWMAHW